MPTITAAQCAALVKQAGFPAGDQVIMVAIARAESGFRTDAVSPPNTNGTVDRGLFQINSVHKYDPNKLVSDATYNTQCAKRIYDSQGLRAWTTYTTGKWKQFENEARQGVAQASGVTGSPALPGNDPAQDGAQKPAVVYGPPGPQFTAAGVGTPMAASAETGAPLAALRVLGQDFGGDYSSVTVGSPSFEAAIETVPHLKFTVVDPEGDLLWNHRAVWVKGAHVQYEDLDMRLDEIVFAPGPHTTGQLELTAVDDIVWALMNLRGARTASGISASEWIAQEMRLVGMDPNKYLLAESVPSQSEIARDVPDQEGQASQGEAPSAWTTIVRLAKELGKRVFISGRRLVFGSSAFAMRWTAPGQVRLSWHALEAGERWLSLPTAKYTSVGNRSDVLEVDGRVPLNRARYFRPGVSVIVRNTPSVAGDSWREFMVKSLSHTIGTDTDGAEIVLVEPVDPPPQPPQTTAAGVNSGSPSNGSSVSGGGADGQVDSFVGLALQQAGKSYVYGAQPSASDPNPRAFDCSALVQWAARRVGIEDPTRTTHTQSAKIRAAGKTITLQQGINTKGALLFTGDMGHVAISLGNGKTIEAMNPSAGVRQGNAGGRFATAGLLVGAKGYRVPPGAGHGMQAI